MKKLGKLTISPDQVMKNEELINLHGGYGEDWCCFCGGWLGMGGANACTCWSLCMEAYGVYGSWVCDSSCV